jgi:hypothetical protein
VIREGDDLKIRMLIWNITSTGRDTVPDDHREQQIVS